MKKLLTILLGLLIALGVFGLVACGGGDKKDDGKKEEIKEENSIIKYNLEWGSYVCLGLQGVEITDEIKAQTENIVIKAEYNGKAVVGIALDAFQGCDWIKSIEIPNTVVSLGQSVFADCTGLTSITLPDSVTSISDKTFFGCKNLQSVKLSNNLAQMGWSTFSGCESLTSVVIPNGITVIDDRTFENCKNLQSVTLSDNILDIKTLAFSGCEKLTTITIPNSVTKIGSYAFNDCKNLQSVTLSSNLGNIGECAFKNCESLASIVIPDSVTIIDKEAFRNCINMKSVTLSNNLKTICTNAFYNCRSLTNIVIPDSVTTVENSVFSECKDLFSLTIGKNVTEFGYLGGCNYLVEVCNKSSIDNEEFSGALRVYSEGESKISITDDGFVFLDLDEFGVSFLIRYMGKGVNTLTLPDGYNNKPYVIREYAFGTDIFYGVLNKDLVKITIPKGVSDIENHAFDGCYSLAEVINLSDKNYYSHYGEKVTSSITNSVVTKTDDGYLFYEDGEKVVLAGYCGEAETLTLPETFNGKNYEIKSFAFEDCDFLKNVTIPNSIEKMGEAVFENCTNLLNVTLPNTLTELPRNTFSLCNNLVKVEIPSKLHTIGNRAFEYCSKLESIDIPSVYSVGEQSFYGANAKKVTCSASVLEYVRNFDLEEVNILRGNVLNNALKGKATLKKLTIGDGVESIGDFAFAECTALEIVVVPDSVTWLGNGAFASCTSLTSASIGDGIENFGESIFAHCENLSSVRLPQTISILTKHTFLGCTSLATIEIPEDVYKFELAVLNNTAITTFTLTSKVKIIGNATFGNCKNLTSVTIENGGITSISDRTFNACPILTEVIIPTTVTYIGEEAFKACPLLTEITYMGTKSQWNSITKSVIWLDDSFVTTVKCTDGNITLS